MNYADILRQRPWVAPIANPYEAVLRQTLDAIGQFQGQRPVGSFGAMAAPPVGGRTGQPPATVNRGFRAPTRQHASYGFGGVQSGNYARLAPPSTAIQGSSLKY